MCLPRAGSKTRIYALYPVHVKRLLPGESDRLNLVTTLNSPKDIDPAKGTVTVELTGYDIYRMKTVTLTWSLTRADPRNATTTSNEGVVATSHQPAAGPRFFQAILCHATTGATLTPVDRRAVFTRQEASYVCCYVYDLRVGSRLTLRRYLAGRLEDSQEYTETQPGSRYVRFGYTAGLQPGTHKIDVFLDQTYQTTVYLVIK